MILGTLAVIGFVAGDTTCNGATNLSSPSGVASTSSFCGHADGFLGVSFAVLVIGALMLAVGSMVLPVLRDRDARRAAAEQRAAAPSVTAAEPSEAETEAAQLAEAEQDRPPEP